MLSVILETTAKINQQNTQDNQNTKKSYMEILWIQEDGKKLNTEIEGKNGMYAKIVQHSLIASLCQVLNWVLRIQSEKNYSPILKKLIL